MIFYGIYYYSFMKRILITGAKGQLGQSIQEAAPEYKNLQCMYTDLEELDIGDEKAIEQILKKNKWDALINCAAYTAVDKAEEEQQKAYRINRDAVRLLSEKAAEHELLMIHISTDFVFDGRKSSPYREEDPTGALSVYGKSKEAGEKEILNSGSGIILRTSWLYSAFGQNFMKTILKHGQEKKILKIVFDQVSTPTSAHDLARVLLQAVCKEVWAPNKPGIYHYSNEGIASWYDFAFEILQEAGLTCKAVPVTSEEYPLPAARPAYSVLYKKKIKEELGIQIPHWKESLNRILDSKSLLSGES